MNFPGRLGLQQRVLPSYRAPFFDLLAGSCAGGLSLFAGQPRPQESIATTTSLRVAGYAAARNLHLFDGALYLCYQAGFLGWLADWNPDALIVEANPRYLSTPSAVRWMKRRGRPVLGWGLGAPPPSGSPHFLGKSGESPPSGSSHFLGKWGEGKRGAFLNQFDGLIAYSQRGADEYAALGFPRGKIFVAHNAVSPAPAVVPKPKPATFDGSPVILFVGRLQARKRVDALLRACAQMPNSPRLVIVGDGPERGRLQQVAAQVYPSAQFVGAKHGDELEPYFAEADLFVLPGTGGLAVQQAMSHGLPVIVAKGDGTQDDLVRAGNGWQIPPEDESALVSMLREALSDARRLRKMGAESYRIVAQEINLEKMVDAFVRALNAV
ncbi:MAG: glycosyltransferase [Chloroflexota bacterium]